MAGELGETTSPASCRTMAGSRAPLAETYNSAGAVAVSRREASIEPLGVLTRRRAGPSIPYGSWALI